MSDGPSQTASPRPFRVTVYASSSERIDRVYLDAAEELGARIARAGFDLVWGGGRYGAMGAVSRGARAAGGRTLGVILQQFIDKNVHCEAAHEMTTLHDMRSRKRGLDELGDAFVAVPGGLGTLEELLEVLSFKQLGFHHKPVVVLNTAGYWQPLLDMFERGIEQGFVQPWFRSIWTVAATPEQALAQLGASTSARGPVDPRGGGTG